MGTFLCKLALVIHCDLHIDVRSLCVWNWSHKAARGSKPLRRFDRTWAVCSLMKVVMTTDVEAGGFMDRVVIMQKKTQQYGSILDFRHI